MVPGEVFAVLDAYDIAISAGTDQVFDGPIDRGQPHLVADDQNVFVVLRGVMDEDQVLRVGAKRLLDQNVPALLHGLEHRIEALVLQRGDDHAFDALGRILKERGKGFEAGSGGDAVRCGERLALDGIRLDNGRESGAVWHFQGVLPEDAGATVSRSDEREVYNF